MKLIQITILAFAFVSIIGLDHGQAKSKKNKNNKNNREYALSRDVAQVDPVVMCKDESQKRLLKLELRGENRFTELKTSAESARVEDTEFSDMGSAGRSRRQRRQAGHSYNGQMVFMDVSAKEKQGWRNLKIRCGVARGKLITFTYEIHDIRGEALPTSTQ